MKKINTKALVDSAVMIAVSTLMIMLSLYVPFFSVIGVLIASVPSAVIAVKHGIKTSITASIALLLVLYIIMMKPIGMFVLFCLMVIPGIISGICIKNDKNFFFTLTLIVLCVVMAFVMYIQIISLLSGGDFVLSSVTEYADALGGVLQTEFGKILSEQTVESLTLNGMENFDVNAFINQLKTQMINMFTLYFPAMLIIISFIIGYLILKTNAYFLKKLRVKEYKANLPFMFFTVPKSVVYVMFLLDFIVLFSNAENGSLVMSAFINMQTVLTFIVFVCGLAFLEFHFKRIVPKGWVRAIVYVIVIVGGSLFMSILAYIIQLIGIFDILFGFRRYLVNQNQKF